MQRYMESIVGFSFYSALIKIVWGLTFLLSFSFFTTSPSYTAMANIGTEHQWGVALLTIGILHIWSIFYTSAYYRITMQTVSIFVWLFIATQLWLANPIGTGKFTYTIAAIIDFIAVVYILKYRRGRYI